MKRNSLSHLHGLSLLLFLFFAAGCDDQLKSNQNIEVMTGTVQGVVVDSASGVGLAGAEVVLLHQGVLKRTTTSTDNDKTKIDEAGGFRFDGIPVETRLILKCAVSLASGKYLTTPAESDESDDDQTNVGYATYTYYIEAGIPALVDVRDRLPASTTDTVLPSHKYPTLSLKIGMVRLNAKLSGQVLTVEGPLEGANVVLDMRDDGYDVILSEQTDNDGRFAFKHIPAVTSLSPGGLSVYPPDETLYKINRNAEPINLGAFDYQMTVFLDMVMGLGRGTITGKVSDGSSGDPIEGAAISVLVNGSWHELTTTLTENEKTAYAEAGTFVAPNLPVGDQILFMATKQGYADTVQSNSIQIVSGQITRVNLTMYASKTDMYNRKAVLRGTIKDGRSGEKVVGAKILALLDGQWQEITDSSDDDPKTLRNEKGTYLSSALPLGRELWLMVVHPDYDDKYNGPSIRLAAGQISELNFFLTKINLKLSGTLYSQFGPLKDATIVLDLAACLSPVYGIRKVTSDAKGVFSISDIPADNGIINNDCYLVVLPFDQNGDGVADYETRAVVISSFLQDPRSIEQLEVTPFDINLHELEEEGVDSRKKPKIVWINVNDANTLQIDESITAFFSISMDEKTLPDQVRLEDTKDEARVETIARLAPDKVTLTIDPVGSLEEGRTYELTISGGFKSLNGTAIDEYQKTFKAIAGLPLTGGATPRFDLGNTNLCDDPKDCLPDTVLVDQTDHYYLNAAANPTKRLDEEGISDGRGLSFDLEWDAVPGAMAYRIYASDDRHNSDWIFLREVSALDPASATVERSSIDIGPFFGGKPYHLGTTLRFTLTSINLDYVEGDLDQSKALTIVDNLGPRVQSAATIDGGQLAQAKHDDIVRVRFSEDLDVATAPQLSVESTDLAATLIGFGDDGDDATSLLLQLAHIEQATTESDVSGAVSTVTKVYVTKDNIFYPGQKVKVGSSVCAVTSLDSDDVIASFIQIADCDPLLIEAPGNVSAISIDKSSTVRSGNATTTAVITTSKITLSNATGFKLGDEIVIDLNGDFEQRRTISEIEETTVTLSQALDNDTKLGGTIVRSKGDALSFVVKDGAGNTIHQAYKTLWGDGTAH